MTLSIKLVKWVEMASGVQNQEISEKTDVIIRAAQKVFGEFGFEKASMNDIARELNYSKASLYYYFQDKESLFRSVIHREQNEFVRLLTEITDKQIPASDQLMEYVDIRHHYFKIFLNLSKLRLYEPASNKSFMYTIINELKEKEAKLVEDIFRRGVELKEFTNINPALVTELFIDVIRGIRLILLKKYDINDISADPEKEMLEKLHSFTDIFIKGIKS